VDRFSFCDILGVKTHVEARWRQGPYNLVLNYISRLRKLPAINYDRAVLLRGLCHAWEGRVGRKSRLLLTLTVSLVGAGTARNARTLRVSAMNSSCSCT